VRNANGTGPFVLKRYEPDARTVLAATRTGGAADGFGGGNLTEVVYAVIQSDATRMAHWPPARRLRHRPAVPGHRAAGAGQALKFRLDHRHRHSVPRLRPVARRARIERRRGAIRSGPAVRRAVYQAIDIDSIVAKVLRGRRARPARSSRRWSPDTCRNWSAGYRTTRRQRAPAEGRRLSERLHGAAGLRHVTFRAACARRSPRCWRSRIRATSSRRPSALFFPKLTQATSSFFEFGWIRPPTPGRCSLDRPLLRRHGAGQFNGGRYFNAKLDG